MAAVPVGFFAGLFGIGGGLISVPFLFFIFDFLNLTNDYTMHLAVGTAFFITIFTSTASVLTHRKHNAVDLSILKIFGFFVISDLANKSPDFSSSIQFFTGGFRLDSGLFSSSLSGLSAPVPLFEWERRDQREDCWRLALSILFLRCRQKSDPS